MRFFRTAASVAALLIVAGAASAADFTLDNVTADSVDNGKNKVVFKKIEFVDTNLTRDEALKLFDAATTKDERVALFKKLQAARIAIPEATLTSKKDDGVLTLRDFVATKIDKGTFQKMTLGGGDAQIPVEDQGGKATIKVGTIAAENGDLSQLLGSLDRPLDGSPMRVGLFTWNGFEVTFPEKMADKAVYHTVKMGSFVARTDYEGDVPTNSVGEVKNIVFVPADGSSAAQGLTMFGYKQLDMGLLYSGTYDPATKGYALKDFTFTTADAGALTIQGVFGNIDKAAFIGDKTARMGAFLSSNVDNVTIRFVNRSLFEKTVDFVAKTSGKDVAAIKQEWSGAVGGLLPMMLGGDPSALKLASAIGEFIANPKSIAINIKGKAGPINVMDMPKMNLPADIPQKLDITAVANR